MGEMLCKAGKMWRLERPRQCEKCPWLKGTDPREIPNGYDEQKHRGLRATIADPNPTPAQIVAEATSGVLRVMACHESHASPCVGWLYNQMGQGNNVALRLHMMCCENGRDLRLAGEQREAFEDTLPAPLAVAELIEGTRG